MIGRLRGTVEGVDGGLLLVECHGVGYEVAVPDPTLASVGVVGAPITLFTRQIVREDAHLLYGFATLTERRIFDLLTSVSGCGPKSALSLLSQVGAEATAHAVTLGDTKALSRANGIGTRTAERIIVELKDKMAVELAGMPKAGPRPSTAPEEAAPDELVEALIALGYRRADAEQAAGRARDEVDDLDGQIRNALQRLRR
ncbi:MAG: Holliday junction branch migration protein RuvA [Fimbriimonadaceae bacterium]|nr:Holliday junction branch migration protein RuvA [Fimbriimonadaceae bacterium]